MQRGVRLDVERRLVLRLVVLREVERRLGAERLTDLREVERRLVLRLVVLREVERLEVERRLGAERLPRRE